MSNVLQLAGEVTLGPLAVNETSFPAGIVRVALALSQERKDARVHTAGVRTLVASDGYVDLRGVGEGEHVTRGSFLYVRTASEMLVRLTTYDSGGDVVAVIPVKGPLIIEFDPSRYLKKLEAVGDGTIEHLVIGPE